MDSVLLGNPGSSHSCGHGFATTYLNIIADQVHPFIAVLSNGSASLSKIIHHVTLHELLENGLWKYEEFQVLP